MSDHDYDDTVYESYDHSHDIPDEEGEEAEVDFDAEDASILDQDPYWSPVRADDLGSYGQTEMIIGIANYFNIGDVGDPEWRSAREVPQGDFALEDIGFYGNVLIFFGREDHPEIAPEADPDLSSSYSEHDPGLRWAIKRYGWLKQHGFNCAENPEMEKLKVFITEAKGFNRRLAEDQLNSVPEWAMDALVDAMDAGREADPEIVEALGEAPSQRSRPVSISPLPSPMDVARFADVHFDYEVTSDVREWCFRLNNGVKEYGPYGDRVLKTRFARSANPENYTELAAYRHEVLDQMLRESGIRYSVGPKVNGLDTYEFRIDDFLSIEEGEKRYGALAYEISKASSIMAVILDHKAKLIAEIERDQVRELLRVRTFVVNKKRVPALDYILERSGKQFACELVKEDLLLAPDALPDNLIANLESRMNEDTYLLQVRSGMGWETMKITRSLDDVAAWNVAQAYDIPYFFRRKKDTLPMPSSLRWNQHGLTAAQRVELETQVSEAISNWKRIEQLPWSTIRNYVKNFNAGHRVKTIKTRTERQTSWLSQQVPLTAGQLRIARQGLAALGDRILNARQASAKHKATFRKLQSMILFYMSDMERYGHKFNPEILKKLASGSPLDIHMGLAEMSSRGKAAQMLKMAGVVNDFELRSESITVPVINFNCVFKNHSEVFGIIKGFRPSIEVTRKAQELIR